MTMYHHAWPHITILCLVLYSFLLPNSFSLYEYTTFDLSIHQLLDFGTISTFLVYATNIYVLVFNVEIGFDISWSPYLEIAGTLASCLTLFFLKLCFIDWWIVCVCRTMLTCAHVWRSVLFFWVLGMKLRLSDLLAIAFTHGATSPFPRCPLWDRIAV